MDGLSQPNFNWPNLLQPTLPLSTVEALLAGMSDDISPEERVYIRVQHAAARLRHAATSENRDWATRQITPVLGSDLQDRRLAHTIYRTVAQVAHDIGAEEIRDPSLENLALYALAAKTPGALIGAAHSWHTLSP